MSQFYQQTNTLSSPEPPGPPCEGPWLWGRRSLALETRMTQTLFCKVLQGSFLILLENVLTPSPHHHPFVQRKWGSKAQIFTISPHPSIFHDINGWDGVKKKGENDKRTRANEKLMSRCAFAKSPGTFDLFGSISGTTIIHPIVCKQRSFYTWNFAWS